jgi:hypothetical protein
VDQRIAVTGLAELNRNLRRVDAEAPKQLRIALNGAADLLVEKTRPEIPSRTGRARASLKARSTRTSARVAMGGTRARYLPWLDFGGRTGRNRSVVRDYRKQGRYLYPTLTKVRPQIEQALQDGIVAVAVGAGLDVT